MDCDASWSVGGVSRISASAVTVSGASLMGGRAVTTRTFVCWAAAGTAVLLEGDTRAPTASVAMPRDRAPMAVEAVVQRPCAAFRLAAMLSLGFVLPSK